MAADLARELPGQLVYLGDQPVHVVFRFRLEPNEFTPTERRQRPLAGTLGALPVTPREVSSGKLV
jgi:hypothetical protein